MSFVIEDSQTIQNMSQSLNSKLWENSTFDSQLSRALGEDYNNVTEILNEIFNASNKIEKWLDAVTTQYSTFAIVRPFF